MKTFILFFTLIGAFSLTTEAALNHSPIIISDSLLNEPAPDFTLKDLTGKKVSLTDLKGKIVVIDFWATWCLPCIQSFPGMQIAKNQYKNDPNVTFLLIDIKEKNSNYKERIQKLLDENNYTFRVLLDEKGTDGLQNKVFKQYGLMAIPATIIIDNYGKIRIKKIGNDPEMSADEIAKEISDLIESVRQNS